MKKNYPLMHDSAISTYEACDLLGIPREARTYTIVETILHYFGIRQFRLMTNNPDKILWMNNAGFTVTQIPVIIPPNTYNSQYLKSKQEIGNHTLGF